MNHKRLAMSNYVRVIAFATDSPASHGVIGFLCHSTVVKLVCARIHARSTCRLVPPIRVPGKPLSYSVTYCTFDNNARSPRLSLCCVNDDGILLILLKHVRNRLRLQKEAKCSSDKKCPLKPVLPS
jgi:hypothetical protein